LRGSGHCPCEDGIDVSKVKAAIADKARKLG
jgi:hypothetical protein